MFAADNLSTFKLNGTIYIIHNYVLKKMAIFSVLFDENNVFKGDMLELEWSVSKEIVDKVFMYMYNESINGNTFIALDVKYCLEIISFMKYFGVEKNIVDHIIKHLLKDIDFMTFYNECSNLEFNSEMKYILLTNYELCNWVNGRDQIKHILSLNFPIDFKIELIKKIIIISENIGGFDIFFAIKKQNSEEIFKLVEDNTIIKSKIDIHKFYKYFGFKIDSFIIKHSNSIITGIFIDNKKIECQNMLPKPYCKEIDKATLCCDVYAKFNVNPRKIKEFDKFLSSVNKTYDTIGYNIAEIIATHLAKLLLGIIEL
jgi:hypothetical protein